MQTSYQNFGETNLAAHHTFKIFHALAHADKIF